MQRETEANREADRGEQIGSADKPNGSGLTWRAAKPATELTKKLDKMVASLGFLVTRQVKDLEKQVKEVKKFYDA